jgi:hypothetical protein
MNEQIKILAKKAGYNIDELDAQEQMVAEKFVDLILKEVLQTCDDHPTWPSRMIGAQIKQNFGIDTKQREINRVREKLENEAAQIKKQLLDLRTECTHPNVILKHGANTGNYDPSQDCYWIDHHCPDCGLKWTREK